MLHPKQKPITFLHESDILSLSPYLSVTQNCLLDFSTGARHKLHPKAAKLLKNLDNCSLNYVRLRCYHLGINESELQQIVFFINSIGGLLVKRKLKIHIMLLANTIKYLPAGIRPVWIGRRYAPTPLNLCKALTRSMLLVILASAVACTIISASLVGASRIWYYATFFLTGLFITGFCHEMAHMIFARKFAAGSSIVQRGLRIGVLRRNSSNRKLTLVSAMSGTVAGISGALLMAICSVTLFNDSTYARIALIIAMMHLVSYLPIYGDGVVIFKQNHEKAY
jgi:hypothetical protein